MNNKLAQFSENAMKFTMDGGLSAYDYKAEEEEAGEDVNFKALAGARSALATDGPITHQISCIMWPWDHQTLPDSLCGQLGWIFAHGLSEIVSRKVTGHGSPEVMWGLEGFQGASA